MPVVHALFEIQYDLLQDLKPSAFVEVILCEYRSFQLYIPRTQCLADISVLHTVAMLQEEPCVGDTVQICDVSYTITAIGFEALHTLKELGHCCLSFSGSTPAPVVPFH